MTDETPPLATAPMSAAAPSRRNCSLVMASTMATGNIGIGTISTLATLFRNISIATPISCPTNACRVLRPRIAWIVDSLCIALLIGTTVYAACRYAALPERIPVHYNAKGVIDGYGGKGMMWLLLAGMWGVVGCLSFVEQFPKCWNTGFRTTKENHVRMLSLTWTLISITKLIVAAMFAYLVMAAIRGGNLPALFMPIVLLALGANFLYWLARAFFVAMRQHP